MGTSGEAPLADHLRLWVLQEDNDTDDDVHFLAWGKSVVGGEGQGEGEDAQEEGEEEEEDEEEADEGGDGEAEEEGIIVPWSDVEIISDAIALLRREESVASNPAAMSRLLHVATRAGLVALVRQLVEQGIGVEGIGAWGGEGGHCFVTTPVLIAAECGNEEIVRLLVGTGANVEARDSDGCTLLHAAATGGNPDIVRYLIQDVGLNPELVDESGCTPLHTAVSAGHGDVVRLLTYELGADVEACDSDGWRALHYAAVSGQDVVVRYLVTDARAEVAAVTENEGCVPLHYASRGGHLGVVKLLADGMDEEDVGALDHEGWSALTYAAAEAWEDVVRFLVGRLGVGPLLVADGEGRSAVSMVQGSCHLALEAFINKVVKYHSAAYRLPGDVILAEDPPVQDDPPLSESGLRCISCRLASGASRRTPLVALLYPSPAGQGGDGDVACPSGVQRCEALRVAHAFLHHPAIQQYMGRVGDAQGLLLEAQGRTSLRQHLTQQADTGGRWKEAARLAEATAEAIEVLHAHGVVHGALCGLDSFACKNGVPVLDMTTSYTHTFNSPSAATCQHDIQGLGVILSELEAWATAGGESSEGYEEMGQEAGRCLPLPSPPQSGIDQGVTTIRAREVRRRLRGGREGRGEVRADWEEKGVRRGCGDAACRDERCRA